VLLAMVAAGAVLRVALVGTGPLTDQIETTQAALRLAVTGGNPYGAGIPGTSTGAPFPYGPLALIAGIPGVWTEVAAAVATMLVFAWRRAAVSLAVFAALPILVRVTVMGTNDTLPGLLIALSVLAAARRPWLGGLLLALATGVKPYAVAWLPGLAGAGGLALAVPFAAASAVAWSPLAVWGVGAYVASVQMAAGRATLQPGGWPSVWATRLLALPLAGLALWRVRSLGAQAAAGAAMFIVVMVLPDPGSFAYLVAPLPIVAIALEDWALRRLARPRWSSR
jgi:hypothetical protein